MWFILIPAGALWLATLLIATLWWVVLLLRGVPAPRYWIHVLVWHSILLPLHLFVTVPVGLTLLITNMVHTRSDESGYRGPWIDDAGGWHLQTRGEVLAEPPGPSREVRLTARDGVPLRAFLVPPKPETCDRDGAPRFVVLLVHGLFRGALEIESPGAMFRDLGGEVLLLELRNHGGSGRARATFGRDEVLDVVAAAEFLRARPEASGRPFVLYAVSLGTAAAAVAAPQLPGLSALVLDAPMDDLAATAVRMLGGGQGKRRFQGFWEPWRTLMLFSARHVARVPFDEVRPRDALRSLPPTLPVLMIGAGHDDRMPPEEVRDLFGALPTRPELKELWIEPEAEHGKVWIAQPEAYRDHLKALVDHIAPR